MKSAVFLAKKRKKTCKKLRFLKFTVHPVAILMWIWLCVVLGFSVAVAYLFAIFLHEISHVIVAKRMGYEVERFSICPYGFSLSFDEKNFEFRDEFWIAFAGPLTNFLSAILCVTVWWLFPESYYFTADFVRISVLLGLFNLLPCYPLDGGRIFVSIASFFISPKVAKKMSNLFNVALSACFFVLFVASIFVNFNPSLLLFSVFLILGSVDLAQGTKLEKFNFFTKKTRNFASEEVLFVNLDVKLGEIVKKITASKTRLFCLSTDSGKTILLSEDAVKKLVIEYGYETTLFELFGR